MIPLSRGELLIVCALGSPSLGFTSIAATSIPALLYPDLRDSAQNYLCGVLSFTFVFICIAPTVVIAIALMGAPHVTVYTVLAVAFAANVAVGAAATSIAGYAFRRFDPTTE
jgi:hypothetical protein